ncbi:hypothetical protein IWX49DRAFT_551836 [Phyllosticta citricarpa]
MSNQGPSEITVAASLAKVADLKLQVTDLQSSVKAEFNKLEAKFKYLQCRNEDLGKPGRKAVETLGDEDVVKEMLVETNRSSEFEHCTKNADDLVGELSGELLNSHSIDQRQDGGKTERGNIEGSL